MRFQIEKSALYQQYAAQIDQASDANAVRQVVRAALADPSAYHAIRHFVGVKARERIAELAATGDAAAPEATPRRGAKK